MSDCLEHAIRPDWRPHPRVRALVTTRRGGISTAPFDSLNLGDHVGDAPEAVAHNRALVAAMLPVAPLWLSQVHGTTVADAAQAADGVEADAAVVLGPERVCTIMTADCLPVLLARRDGQGVGAAHAGWRGLCNGVLEATVERLGGGEGVEAWLGPAIGPSAFEVGEEVRAAFMQHDPAAAAAFQPGRLPGKWWADIYLLARQRLAHAGVTAVSGGGFCTVTDAARFYSYRRERETGRMASMIWLE
ncbi:MAG: peptidoglycan editing factor PgeF [Burkholderiales bacterium]|nr:peptidoglycan editing factor PgeF [Burkholderiales bacterium]